MHNSYHSMSLRVRKEIEYDFVLTYSLAASPSSKILTKAGVISLCLLPIMYFLASLSNMAGFELFLAKKIDIGLFVVGASLVLPSIQADHEIRRQLMAWYLMPIGLGLLMVFV